MMGLRITAVCFLAVSVPIETVYSWRGGLADPYYVVKLIGWFLLAAGVFRSKSPPGTRGLPMLTAGWAWLAANFWRAVADRISDVNRGETLRLGSVELWFASGCLIVCLAGLGWSLRLAAPQRPR